VSFYPLLPLMNYDGRMVKITNPKCDEKRYAKMSASRK
jgi:hypothetical protein